MSQAAASYLLERAQAFGFKTELIDVKDYPFAATEQEIPGLKELGQKLASADGFLIVTPEYNHGYPGELKQLLDAFYQEYNRKPVGLCGVSSGQFGGARAVEQLRLVAIELQMVPMRNAVYIAKDKEAFSAEGVPADSSLEKRAHALFEELSWYAAALKKARQLDKKKEK